MLRWLATMLTVAMAAVACLTGGSDSAPSSMSGTEPASPTDASAGRLDARLYGCSAEAPEQCADGIDAGLVPCHEMKFCGERPPDCATFGGPQWQQSLHGCYCQPCSADAAATWGCSFCWGDSKRCGQLETYPPIIVCQ